MTKDEWWRKEKERKSDLLDETGADHFNTIWEASTLAERERCAMVCEDLDCGEDHHNIGGQCADAIRNGDQPRTCAHNCKSTLPCGCTCGEGAKPL